MLELVATYMGKGRSFNLNHALFCSKSRNMFECLWMMLTELCIIRILYPFSGIYTYLFPVFFEQHTHHLLWFYHTGLAVWLTSLCTEIIVHSCILLLSMVSSMFQLIQITHLSIRSSKLTFIVVIGVPVGYYSSSLKELLEALDDSVGNEAKWLELSPADSTVRFFVVIILWLIAPLQSTLFVDC